MSRFKPNIKKNLIWIFFIAIFLLLLNHYLSEISKKNIDQNKNALILGGSFELIDQNNNIFSSKSLPKFKLIYFGYTFCPDFCPFDLIKVSNIFKKNKKLINTIQPIFITIDPERDNHNVIKNFLEGFEIDIVGLTGSKININDVLKKFKIYNKKRKDSPSDENYLIDHSILFFLIDENDKYIRHFSSKNFEDEFTSFINSSKLFN